MKRRPNALLVLCTIDTKEHAEHLARELLRMRLAACINILPHLSSLYRWEGAIEKGEELLLLIKTKEELFETLKEKIVSLHPYSVPEIIAFRIDEGAPHYLEWIMKETL